VRRIVAAEDRFVRPLLSRSSIVTIAVVVMAACAGEAASPDDPLGLAEIGK
jgi:hypothetical protein